MRRLRVQIGAAFVKHVSVSIVKIRREQKGHCGSDILIGGNVRNLKRRIPSPVATLMTVLA